MECYTDLTTGIDLSTLAVSLAQALRTPPRSSTSLVPEESSTYHSAGINTGEAMVPREVNGSQKAGSCSMQIGSRTGGSKTQWGCIIDSIYIFFSILFCNGNLKSSRTKAQLEVSNCINIMTVTLKLILHTNFPLQHLAGGIRSTYYLPPCSINCNILSLVITRTSRSSLVFARG